MRSRKRSGGCLEIEAPLEGVEAATTENTSNTGMQAQIEYTHTERRPTSWMGKFQVYSGFLADILVLVVCLVIFAALELAHPRATFIPTDIQYQYSYPMKIQTVPAWTVPLIAFVLPIVCFVTVVLLAGRHKVELYRLIIALAITILLTGSITNSLKLAISRPRPNFIASCWPSSPPVWVNSNAFGGYPQCSTPISEYGEHMKSFPSGHSSMSASGLGFLTFFLLGQTRAYVGGSLSWRMVLSLLPGLGAVAIAVSRVTDYWHHTSDAGTGLVIGFVTAFAVYRQMYPGFTHTESQMLTLDRSYVPQQVRPEHRGLLAGPDGTSKAADGQERVAVRVMSPQGFELPV